MVNIHLINKQYLCDKNTEGLLCIAALGSKNRNWLPSVEGIFKDIDMLYVNKITFYRNEN